MSNALSAGVLPGVGSLKPMLGIELGVIGAAGAGANKSVGGVYGAPDDCSGTEVGCNSGPRGCALRAAIGLRGLLSAALFKAASTALRALSTPSDPALFEASAAGAGPSPICRCGLSTACSISANVSSSLTGVGAGTAVAGADAAELIGGSGWNDGAAGCDCADAGDQTGAYGSDGMGGGDQAGCEGAGTAGGMGGAAEDGNTDSL